MGTFDVLLSHGRGDRNFARTLDAWLRAHPGATVLWACPQFRSARVRQILDAVLGPADARRVRVRGLADHRFDETNWWSSRQGLWYFAVGWLLRLDGWLGDNAPPVEKQSADEYDAQLSFGVEGEAAVKTGTGSELTGAAVTTNGRRGAPVPVLRRRRRVAAVVLCGAAAVVLWASHAAILRAWQAGSTLAGSRIGPTT